MELAYNIYRQVEGTAVDTCAIDLTEEEYKIWLTALDLGEKGRNEIKGNDLDYYLSKLNDIRDETYRLFKEKDDEWLHKESDIWGQTGNNYFMWFHVFEDEINHRGQINLLKKRIPNT